MLTAIQQTPDWLNFQITLPNRQGWQIDELFVYKLSFKPGWDFLYLPGITAWPNAEVQQKVINLAKEENCFFIHYEPYIMASNNDPKTLTKSPLHYIEPYTQILDLTQTEDQLHEQLDSKCRYSLRQAEKHQIEIRTENSIDNFYNLLSQTTSRNDFNANPKSYYQTMINQLGNEHCQVVTAFYQGVAIASNIITFTQTTGTYYYGASSSNKEHRKTNAPYLLQWHCILAAQKRGCQFYDLMGIAPPSRPNHRLAGVSRFKSKFGGKITQFQTAQDQPINWFKYVPFYIYKKIR